MEKRTFYLLLLILIAGCTHRIVRTGYQVSKADYKNCDITIKKFMTVTDSLEKVGEIKLGESGFAVACSEAHALEILKNEGCALNADMINIVDETRPDLLSSCYRCNAVFYKIRGTEMKNSDNAYYKAPEIEKRVGKDRTRNTIIGFGVGIIAFVLTLYAFK